jgi:hypothetical protein
METMSLTKLKSSDGESKCQLTIPSLVHSIEAPVLETDQSHERFRRCKMRSNHDRDKVSQKYNLHRASIGIHCTVEANKDLNPPFYESIPRCQYYIRSPFRDTINGRLNMSTDQNRHHTRIHNSQSLGTIDLQFRTYNSAILLR